VTDDGPPHAGRRDLFAVPDDVAYFNAASMAPVLRASLAAGEAALARRAAPWDFRTADWFDESERLRALAGGLFGGDTEGVALVPATSYGMAIAAANLRDRVDEGRAILVLDGEYPSGVNTWRRLAAETGAPIVTATRVGGGSWADAVLGVIDERVGIVSAPGAHWTDGARVDLVRLGERARAVGAALVVDASQTLGAVPFPLDAVRPDLVVAVGYKWLLGPVGRSYLWVAPHLRDGRPLEENWIVRAGADDFAALADYTDEYMPGARRFDQGQRTLPEVTPMAVAALEQVLAWRPERIGAALAGVTGEVVARLGERGLAPTVPEAERSPHIVGFPVPAAARAGVLGILEARGCFVSLRGTSLRIAPHLHVTPDDVDRLVAAVDVALRPVG
jgi:selenocysteine lyase/cysteine desulfurase